MKKFIIISIVLTIVLSGCRYKEGPMISLRSAYKRIEGYWQIIEFTSNGVDSLKYYNDSCGALAFIGNFVDGTSDKRYKIVFNYMQPNAIASNIKFNDKKDIMFIDFLTNQKHIIGPIGYGKSEWKILKLTNKQLKTSIYFNNLNYIILFKKTTL